MDFVANYYGLGLKAAAEKIATDFVLAYDDKRYSENIQKKIIPKKSEYQIWAERKRELFANLSRLHEKLRQMKIKYEPKLREDSDWSPLFSLAVKDFTYVDYLYDYCMFEATEDNMNITKNFFIFCCRTLFPFLQSMQMNLILTLCQIRISI